MAGLGHSNLKHSSNQKECSQQPVVAGLLTACVFRPASAEMFSRLTEKFLIRGKLRKSDERPADDAVNYAVKRVIISS